VVPFGSQTFKSLERQAAYNVASREASAWADIIHSNRHAKQLDLTSEPPPAATIEQLTKPALADPLSAAISAALRLPEALEQPPSPSSAATKAKLRSETFYQYQKQKRIAKIKSKLYHKIRNKRKNKQAFDDEEEKAEKESLMRIEERMSLRHSAKKLKKAVNRYQKDEGKKVIAENEALRQRIRNPSRVNSEGNVVYESSSEDDEAYLAEQLKLELESDGETKGIMGMKFMKEAMKRQREKEQNLSEGLLKDLEAETSKFKFDGDPHKKQKIEKQEKKKLEQQTLVQQAFAMDEMDQIAAEEWAKEQKEKEDKKPKTMQGWGSWFGSGIRPKSVHSTPAVFKCEKVIINEERDKRAAKYLVKKLPFPFKSSRQFDAVHKIPVGKEWNAKRVYQKQIAPDLITRPGEPIGPISK
jgi:U3 small nucleolar RNA-associated protein 14